MRKLSDIPACVIIYRHCMLSHNTVSPVKVWQALVWIRMCNHCHLVAKKGNTNHKSNLSHWIWLRTSSASHDMVDCQVSITLQHEIKSSEEKNSHNEIFHSLVPVAQQQTRGCVDYNESKRNGQSAPLWSHKNESVPAQPECGVINWWSLRHCTCLANETLT